MVATTGVSCWQTLFKKTGPNMSEYRPDYLFLVRHRRFERSSHHCINFLSYLSFESKIEDEKWISHT